MVVEGLTFLGGMIGAVVLLGPTAARRLEPHRWRPGATTEASARERWTHQSAFEPLDLGPDPVQWPSERAAEREETGPAVPDWPSMSWDDEHFGTHWNRQPSLPQATTAADAATPDQAARRGRPRSGSPRSAANEEAIRRNQAGPPPAAAQPPAVTQPSSGAPSREEIEELIGQVGLAGTVQAIMERTGWDFRRAATFLARARKG